MSGFVPVACYKLSAVVCMAEIDRQQLKLGAGRCGQGLGPATGTALDRTMLCSTDIPGSVRHRVTSRYHFRSKFEQRDFHDELENKTGCSPLLSDCQTRQVAKTV